MNTIFSNNSFLSHVALARASEGSTALKAEKQATLAAPVEGTAKDVGENPSDHNNPPVIEGYHATSENKDEAIKALKEISETTRKNVNSAMSKFEQIALVCADVAYFIAVEKKRIPSFKEISDSVRFHVLGIGKQGLTQGEKDARKALRDAKKGGNAGAGKLVDKTENYRTSARATFETNLRLATMAGLLVLLGKEQGYSTTYQHVQRYTDGGKVVPQERFNEATGEWPTNTYRGIGYNQHVLMPYVQIATKKVNGKEEPVYQLRSENAKYADHPIVGMTMESVKVHFDHFIGRTTKAGTVKNKVDDKTGLPPKAERAAGGSQAAPAAKTIIKFDESISRLDVLNAALQVTRGLPEKEESLSEAEREVISNLVLELDKFQVIWGNAAEEDTDESVSRAMQVA